MTKPLTPRQRLDADVARAQRAALAPGRVESQATRDRRLADDRARVEAVHAAVAQAQVDQANAGREALEALTPAERQAGIEAARRAVQDRQAAIVAAVDAENAARAKAIAG